MGVMIDVIKDEYHRLKKLVDFYDKKIASLPKGSISRKKRHNGIYYYLAFRDQDKVIFKYLGKEDSKKFNEVSEQVYMRQRYEAKRKEAIENLKEVEVILRAAK